MTETVQEEATQNEEVASQEDPSVYVGKVLGRSRRVIFDIPESIRSVRKAYREVAAEELRNRKTTLQTIRNNVDMVFAPDTDQDTLPALVKVVRDLHPLAAKYAAAAKEKGAEQLKRIEELSSKMKAEKEELAKDFASETIEALIPTD